MEGFRITDYTKRLLDMMYYYTICIKMYDAFFISLARRRSARQ